MRRILLMVVPMMAIAVGAMAAVYGDQIPRMSGGAIDVQTGSATAIPTLCTKGINTFAIYNNGPNIIWCGRLSTVTNVTGFPVCAGCALTVDMVCTASQAQFYCRADTANQATPLNTRYLEVK